MKFISWNVNGLRAALGKGFVKSFNQLGADIFCLQETKMQRGQAEIDLPGYFEFWNSAEKKGYSGTAVFSKTKPLAESYGLNLAEHDREGRVITLEYEKFILVNVYTPNSQDELARLGYRMTWEDSFRDYLIGLDKKKPLVICGDLNVAHKEIDLKNPKTNQRSAGFTIEERNKMTELLGSGFSDTFRTLYPEATGAYSWWSYRARARERNAGWRIDYFIVSERLMPQVTAAAIHADILGSDHCPVSVEIKI